MQWRKRPVIYEINAQVWLGELRAKYREPLTLGTIPALEWDALAALQVDAIWFMGVWERSPEGIVVSNANVVLQAEFRRALADYLPADNIGSAYCVRDYVVDAQLGGAEALAQARAELTRRGLMLILDFVPNHVALDHAWLTTHPEYFIRGTADDLARLPNQFFERGGNIFANGRDPYFPPWRDTAQLNAFDTELRAASIETARSIAAQCDGLRCDMAMLMLNEIFSRIWEDRAGPIPATNYWSELIPAVKAKFSGVLFIAEAYWDLEFTLMQEGFDYCYDKRLYDRLERQDAASVRLHLNAGAEYQDKLVRFIENHDEARAAAAFSPQRERAAAVAIATLPGAKLFYEGQFEGRKIKLPVFLPRRAPEPRNYDLELFYRALLSNIHADVFQKGEWALGAPHGWSDNASFENLLAWTWRQEQARLLIIINFSDHRSQGMVPLPWEDLRGRVWRMSDVLNGEVFLRDGDQLCDHGLFVDLDAWRFHFLEME